MRKSHPILSGIETVRPYRMVTGHSLYTIEPPAMQIDEFLPVGGIMGITANPGAGKSWLAMAIAKAVGGGEQFLGKFKARRGGVLFVGSDSSLYDYARQWTRLTSQTELAAHVYEPVRFLVQSSFMFEDRDEVRRLIATHRSFEWGDYNQNDAGMEREKGFHVIVFDTVSKLTRENQNDNTGMEEVFRHIRWIAEATNAAIILIHHNSRRTEFNDGEGWRGASAGDGALDSRIQLTPSRKDKFRIAVEFKKFRGITPASFVYKMNVSDPAVASLVYDEESTKATSEAKADKQAATDELSKLILATLANGVKKRLPEIRDAIYEQVKVGANGPIAFDDPTKLDRAIRNRIPGMMVSGEVSREASPEGKPVYSLLIKEKSRGKVVEQPAKPSGGSNPINTPPAAEVVPEPSSSGSGRHRRTASPGVRRKKARDSGAGGTSSRGG